MINETYRKPLIAILVIALVLIFIFGSGAMNSGMTSETRIYGYVLVWVPTLITLGLGILLGWILFGKKR